MNLLKTLFVAERKIRHLLIGFPAIVMLLGVGIVCVHSSEQSRELMRDYRDKAIGAYARKDYDEAEILLKRVLQVPTPYASEARLTLFDIYLKTNRVSQAYELLNTLAPENGSGHPRAHFWKAIQIGFRPATEAGQLTKKELRVFRNHLVAGEQATDLLKQKKFAKQFHVAFARYWLHVGNRDEATRYLRLADDPDLYLLMGDLQLYGKDQTEEQRQRRREMAADMWRKSVGYYEKKLVDEPDNTDYRLDLVNGLLKQARFSQQPLALYNHAVQVLQEGIPFNETLFKGHISNVLLSLYRALPEDTNLSPRLEILSKALQANPDNFAVAPFLLEFRDDAAEDRVYQQVEDAITEAKNSPIAHFILSILEHERGDVAASKLHLELALQSGSNLPVLLNNLAELLKDEDPERALALIDRAISADPSDVRFLATRAGILAALSRSTEAILDYEKALPAIDAKYQSQIHLELADLYESLGQSNLAASHRRQAREAASIGD